MNNFEKLGLYPHNIDASKKVKKQFDDGAKTVSIIHATGTGKTYIALYLALEYKNEKIVWVVPTNAIKEHIEKTINDNPYIDMKKDFPNLEIRTYTSLVNLTKKEIENIPCDFFIVDELQHLAAPVWGERTKTFKETHENLKTFGMTAYNVNYRGTVYERDLTNPETNEIFSNTVESIYDLYDAMIDGVLPKPITKSVITEDSEIVLEIKEKIEILKRKGDKTYLEYEKMLSDIVKMIHKQGGVKKLIQQCVKPNGKYIYFCPIFSEKGKNDMNTIMETMRNYLQEKFPNQKMVFYKSTSADGEYGKYNRDCFYHDKDLDGNDASDAIKIIFVKNQYNEGVHAPNVDGVFLGRRTRSDIVAFEQIGRALSVRGNTHKKMEEYSHYDIEQLKELAIQRGISIKQDETKQQIIEKLVSPIIIDLADNIDFIQELETNLGDRIKEIQAKGKGNKRIIKINDSNFDIEVINKDLFEILEKIRTKLNAKTWDDWYNLAKEYYNHYGNSEIPYRFKTTNGIDYDEEGFKLGIWCQNQRASSDSLGDERRKKLEAIKFRFENKKVKMEWDVWYELARAYYNYYGNSEIPVKFKTTNGIDYDEEGFKLGIWCRTQRVCRDKLTEERRKKLEVIEFRFENKIAVMQWDVWYELARAYYNYYGNSEIPVKFKTTNGIDYDEEGFKLGIWCHTQRVCRDKLTEERRKKLEVIEFRFENKIAVMQWDEWYELARTYYNHYGNSEIPVKFKTTNGIDYDEEGFKLGIWCRDQKTNSDSLEDERRKKLEAIKFRFENKKVKMEWGMWYELARAYYNYYGNSEIPVKFKTTNGIDYDEEGFKLGIWCRNQRINSDSLGDERRKKLEAIEFRFENKIAVMQWNEWYELAKEYYNHYGNLEIKDKFKTINGIDYDEEGFALGIWCQNQRSRRDKLTEEQRKKLEAIEFRFNNKNVIIDWDEWYELAKVYYNHYGNLEIKDKFKTINGIDYDEEGFKLGIWCRNQRINQDKLSEEQRKKLEVIEFRFEKERIMHDWNELYNLAKKYYLHYGNSEIPASFKTTNGYEYDANGINLGNWYHNQRKRTSKLTEEQRNKLDLIEFRFITKKDKKEENKNLCLRYGIDYNKHKFLHQISYQELYAKIMYLSENKYPLEINGQLHEIFTMSNEHMQLKYHISKEQIITKYYINAKKRG